MSMKRIVMVVTLMVFSQMVGAQDVCFSQNHSCQMYLNPSLAGNCEGSRLALNYRNQWPYVGGLQTMNLCFDQNLEAAKSGVGVQVIAYWPSKIQNYYDIKLYYAYNLQVADEFFVRAGIGGGLNINQFSGSKATLPDNWSDNHESVGDSTIVKPDFSVGFSFCMEDVFYVGVSADHVTLQADNPVRYVVSTGANFHLDSDDFVVSPSAVFIRQNGYSLLNIGAVVRYQSFEVGAGYNANLTNIMMKNIHSLTLIGGITMMGVDLRYSYDIVFGGVGVKTHGAHEISVVYCFGGYDNGYRNRKRW